MWNFVENLQTKCSDISKKAYLLISGLILPFKSTRYEEFLVLFGINLLFPFVVFW